jgi:transcriptional regulator with XRE-family HTH domain
VFETVAYEMKRSARPQPEIGAAIREVREKRGLTQEALAAEAGTTLSTLSVIERGRANPTWATVGDIAAALGVSVAELAKCAEKHS